MIYINDHLPCSSPLPASSYCPPPPTRATALSWAPHSSGEIMGRRSIVIPHWLGWAGLGWLLGRGDLVKQTRGSPAQPSPAQPCVPGTTLALWRGGIRSEYEKKHQSNDLASALLCSRLCWLHASLEPQKTTAQQSASFILEADN